MRLAGGVSADSLSLKLADGMIVKAKAAGKITTIERTAAAHPQSNGLPSLTTWRARRRPTRFACAAGHSAREERPGGCAGAPAERAGPKAVQGTSCIAFRARNRAHVRARLHARLRARLHARLCARSRPFPRPFPPASAPISAFPPVLAPESTPAFSLAHTHRSTRTASGS